MGARTGRVIGITAASLIWLAGCETTSSLNPFKFVGSDAIDSQAKSDAQSSGTDTETTGTVPPPVGDPPTQPELLGTDPYDNVNLAKNYFRQGSYGLAERHFRKAVELHPKQLDAWVGLAASYDRLRRFDLADRAYAQAIRLGGSTPEILNNQGFSYMLRGDFGRARTTLLAAQAKDRASPYIQNNLRLLEQAVRKKKMVN
jgi:Flp pilus assembly protein TadD